LSSFQVIRVQTTAHFAQSRGLGGGPLSVLLLADLQVSYWLRVPRCCAGPLFVVVCVPQERRTKGSPQHCVLLLGAAASVRMRARSLRIFVRSDLEKSVLKLGDVFG
jgi:hypothetical protein